MAVVAPNIAVVDDDESVRRALHRLLRSAGFSATTFASAYECLEATRRQSFACLILDVRLGGTSGLEVAEHLARQGRHIPIIIITAFDDAAVREGADRAGAHAYLPKPVDAQLLIQAVRSAVDAPPPEATGAG